MFIVDSEIILQYLIEKVGKKSEENGLFVNVKKTKILISGKNKVVGDADINGDKLEQVEQFTYLRSEVTEQRESKEDIWRRLAISRETYLEIYKMF